MKTKITTNLLNNQNYILGNIEKKKLLSKFFVEKNIKDFLIFLSKMNYVFEEKIYILSLYFSFIFFQILLYIFVNNYFFGNLIYNYWLIFIIIIPIFYLIYNLSILNNFSEKNNIKSFKEYIFYNGNVGLFFYGIIIFVLGQYSFIKFIDGSMLSELSSSGFLYSIMLYIMSFSVPFFYGMIFVLLLSDLIKKIKLFQINFMNIVLLPIFILLELFILLYSFIFKGEKGYFFIKTTPYINLFYKFDKIKINYAYNKLYFLKER